MCKSKVMKYIGLLLMLFALFLCMHRLVVGPFIDYMIVDKVCNTMIHSFTFAIIEPVICVLITVRCINKEETQFYDSLKV